MAIILTLLIFLTAACAGTSTLQHIRSDGTSLRVTVLEDTNAFAVSWHYSVLEECVPGATGDETCRRLAPPQFLGLPGYFPSLFGASVRGGAILGAGYAIGEGLKSDQGLNLNVRRGIP